MATDPVCNMTFEPDKAAAKAEYRGTTYYFCSQGCHQAFTAAPEKYARQGELRHPSGGGSPGRSREK